MVNAIATSVAGMQKAADQVTKAANAIAAAPNALPQDIVDIGGEAVSGSLEASIVGLKVAANSYKANAQALTIALEAQKDAFDALI